MLWKWGSVWNIFGFLLLNYILFAFLCTGSLMQSEWHFIKREICCKWTQGRSNLLWVSGYITNIYVFISQVQGRCLQLSLSVQNCFGRPTFTCYNLCWHTQHWTTREVTLSSVEKILTQNLSCLAEGWSCVGLVMSLMPEKLIKQDKTHILCRCKVMSLVFKQSALIPTWIIKWKFINYRCTSLSKFD